MFVSLPTGFGKSLCYGLLPLVFDLKRFGDVSIQRSIVIVVSPLIALMRDQVQSFAEKGLKKLGVSPKKALQKKRKLGSWYSSALRISYLHGEV